MKPILVVLFDRVLHFNISATLTFILTVSCALNLDSVGTFPTDTSLVNSPLALPLTRDEFSYSGQSQESSLKSEWDWDLMESSEIKHISLNNFCTIDDNFETVICKGLKYRTDLPEKNNEFTHVKNGIFLNISIGGDLRFLDFHRLFPNLMSLNIGHSPGTAQQFLHELWSQHLSPTSSFNADRSSSGTTKRTTKNSTQQYGANANRIKNFSWHSVRHLNLSGNELESNSFPFGLMKVFPNLTELDLGRNNITTLANIPPQTLNQLRYIDLSGKSKVNGYTSFLN